LQNYYNFTEDAFVPAKFKQSVGGVVRWLVSSSSAITLRGSYFRVHVDDGPYLPVREDTSVLPVTILGYGYTPPSQNYTGWTLALSGRLQF